MRRIFFVVVLAFVPFLLELTGFTERAVWRGSSAIWVLAFAPCMPLIQPSRFRV